MIQALHLPMAFGMDARRRVSVPLPPDVYATIEDSADRRELGLLIGPFCARLVRQFMRLEFLSTENQAFLRELRGHLPGLELVDVINLTLTSFRRAVQSGSLVPSFFLPQGQSSAKTGMARSKRARATQAVVAPAEECTR